MKKIQHPQNGSGPNFKRTPVRLEFTHPKAATVCIAGRFNNWRPESKTLHSSGTGRWWKETALAPGTYEYCLVVDGRWIPDPQARGSVPNPCGGRNSVLNVPISLEAGHLADAEKLPMQTNDAHEMDSSMTQKIPILPAAQKVGAGNKPAPSPSGVEKTSPETLYSIVAEQPFFKGMDARQIQVLAESAMKLDFEAGQSIFLKGSPANRFYIILEGEVVLESDNSPRGTVAIQTVGAGEDLGCSWLFAPYYFYLSARALVPTKTIFFYGTRLRDQCERDHELGYEMMKRIAEVMIKQLQATQRRLAQCTDTTVTAPSI